MAEDGSASKMEFDDQDVLPCCDLKIESVTSLATPESAVCVEAATLIAMWEAGVGAFSISMPRLLTPEPTWCSAAATQPPSTVYVAPHCPAGNFEYLNAGSLNVCELPSANLDQDPLLTVCEELPVGTLPPCPGCSVRAPINQLYGIGGAVCKACREFFKKQVLCGKNAYLLVCNEQDAHLSPTRLARRCQKCRLTRCLSVGLSSDQVVTAAIAWRNKSMCL